MKENNAWGLRQFFKRRDGELEDYLVLLINRSNNEVTIYIGDESLLDDFQASEEDFDSAQMGELVS